MTNTVVPTVHLNGTSKRDLLEQYMEAGHALREAMRAIPRPNGRDYYVQGAGAIDAAIDQCNAALSTLKAILDQMNHIATEIDRQR